MKERGIWDAVGAFLQPHIRRAWPKRYVSVRTHNSLLERLKVVTSERDEALSVLATFHARVAAAESVALVHSRDHAENIANIEKAIDTRVAHITAGQRRQVDELTATNQLLLENSPTDPVTEMSSGFGLESRFADSHSTLIRALSLPDTNPRPVLPFSAMMVNISVSKKHNRVDNRKLVLVAGLITRLTVRRDTDIAAHLGDGLFLIIFPRSDARFAMVKGAEFLCTLRQTVPEEEVPASVGVAEIEVREHTQSATETLNWLFRMVDRACRESQRQGNNRVVRYSEALAT